MSDDAAPVTPIRKKSVREAWLAEAYGTHVVSDRCARLLIYMATAVDSHGRHLMDERGYWKRPQDETCAALGLKPRRLQERLAEARRAGLLAKVGGGRRGQTVQYRAQVGGQQVRPSEEAERRASERLADLDRVRTFRTLKGDFRVRDSSTHMGADVPHPKHADGLPGQGADIPRPYDTRATTKSRSQRAATGGSADSAHPDGAGRECTVGSEGEQERRLGDADQPQAERGQSPSAVDGQHADLRQLVHGSPVAAATQVVLEDVQARGSTADAPDSAEALHQLAQSLPHYGTDPWSHLPEELRSGHRALARIRDLPTQQVHPAMAVICPACGTEATLRAWERAGGCTSAHDHPDQGSAVEQGDLLAVIQPPKREPTAAERRAEAGRIVHSLEAEASQPLGSRRDTYVDEVAALRAQGIDDDCIAAAFFELAATNRLDHPEWLKDRSRKWAARS